MKNKQLLFEINGYKDMIIYVLANLVVSLIFGFLWYFFIASELNHTLSLSLFIGFTFVVLSNFALGVIIIIAKITSIFLGD